MRIGNAVDIHRLVRGRDLVLGGVKIKYHKGLLGHSDADCLTHAVISALIGAAGLGDIGTWFPDTDDEFKDISSIELLRRTAAALRERGFKPQNVDTVITAQAPRLCPYYAQMRENIARALEIPAEFVNIKAATTEGLGFIGRGKGIAAAAVCLLSEI